MVGIDPMAGDAIRGETVVAQENKHMLYTIAVILVVLWLVGLVTSYTLGGFLHILLVIAIVMVIFNLLQGRRL